MKIQVDLNDPEAVAVLSSMDVNDYYIIEDQWEDGEEFAIIYVGNEEWATWIRLKHSDWITN